MKQVEEPPDDIDDDAADRALDRELAMPPTDAEREWYANAPARPDRARLT